MRSQSKVGGGNKEEKGVQNSIGYVDLTASIQENECVGKDRGDVCSLDALVERQCQTVRREYLLGHTP